MNLRNQMNCMLSVVTAVVVAAGGVSLPNAFGADAQTTRDSRVKAAVLGILEAGLAEDGSLKKAKFAFDRTRLIRRDNSLIPYAWGLVLLQHNESSDAAQQFLVSTRQGDQKFLPAWQMLAWTQMINGDRDEALEAVAAVAVVLATRAAAADSVGEDPTEDDLASAAWLAEFLMAASTSARRKSEESAVDSYSTRITNVFDGPLADAFETGREQFSKRLQTLKAELEQAHKKVPARQKQKDKERTTEIESALKNAEAEQKDSTLFAGDAKTWLEETLRKLDRELGRLERDYQFLSDQDKKLAQNVVEVHKQMRLAELRRETQSLNYLRLEEQLLSQQQSRSSLQRQAGQTVQRGQQLIIAKQQAIGKYEAATGQLVKKQANLERWKQRLGQEKESLAKPGSDAPVSRRLKSFRTLLPFDIAAARGQLEAILDHGEDSK
jgi:hypothetical protein